MKEQQNRYHITWYIGKDEHGADLSTGKTYEATSMRLAQDMYEKEHPDKGEPIYVLHKD